MVVTGGAGFIGSHLVDRLAAAGNDVVVVDDLSTGSEANLPPRAAFTKVDLATPEAVAAIVAARPDVVIHCAAQTSVPVSFENPVLDARANIVGSLNVIEACRRAQVDQLVYVTTGGALYGDAMTEPWDEQAHITPISPYGISKSIVESYLSVLEPALRMTILRFANVYGPRQGSLGEAGVVATFIDRMRTGASVVIHGDGEQTRDLVYVADAVDAIEAAMAVPASGTFNIGTGAGVSVNVLFRELAALMAYRYRPEHGPARLGDIRFSALDSTRAGTILGWRPRTALDEGLAKTVAG